jgi:hypothetical protein
MMNQQGYGMMSAPNVQQVGTTTAPVGSWQQQQQHQHTMMPVDILGLADKAASAVQALASENNKQHLQNQSFPYTNSAALLQPYATQQQQPQMGSQQPMPYSPMTLVVQQQHIPYQPNNISTGPPLTTSMGGALQRPVGGGRRTTASLGQLSSNVQYAVQVRTGSILCRKSFGIN